MQIDQIRELYNYNDWANERLWQAVTGLSMDQLNIDMHNGMGSIFTTLIHLVGATWIWRKRWEGDMPTRMLPFRRFPYSPVNSYTLARGGRAHAALPHNTT
jgi:uncharacterized damage-inducible protein DinB